MYLEKLEIQGFKSFANKNVLVFPGMLDKDRRGLTAVVGPNGSGKSNIADAIRWALGEQSMKSLRGKKSEDVIFSGSDKKGKLGMAEVSLFLNNEDGRAPIEYPQIVLTRRLYRDGASEYLINGARVRLFDVQMILAKANFGQKTYSVIGQGTVDGFLNTSLAERKEFFDEATGVKQYQIKRDDALNKLTHSHENLNQAGMLVAEIEPRLRSLTRQVEKLKRRGELESELKALQIKYYGLTWHEIDNKFSESNNKFLEGEKAKMDKEKKLESLNRELGRIEAENKLSEEFSNWQREVAILEEKRNNIMRSIARLDAQLEARLETKGDFDLSWLNRKKEELAGELENIKVEINQIGEEKKVKENKFTELNKVKSENDRKYQDLKSSLLKLSSVKNIGGEENIIKRLNLSLIKLEKAEAEYDIEKIKIILKEIREELKAIVGSSDQNNNNEELEKARMELEEMSEAREKIVFESNEFRLAISTFTEKGRMSEERNRKIKEEIRLVESKLKSNISTINEPEIIQEKENLKKEEEALGEKIKEIKEKINNFSRTEEEKRTRIFALQKNLQIFQNEINVLSNDLNNFKINATRYETRLEDLENEIRNNLGGMKEVREYQTEDEKDINPNVFLERINGIKRQLEQIGGIDPEVEKEYHETKERFDFLDSQSADLNQAIGSLEKLIEDLDAVIKEKFDQEFKVIAQKFEEYFKILFNGGSAKIIKVLAEDKKEETSGASEEMEPSAANKDEDDDVKKIKFLGKYNATGLAGIEIQATPPGKKIKSISMLSGGERALTAIALICAIISANPSPFVVLDEVDAALDEANSERLAKILDDLSHKTQFIVVTHNRASMRRAVILYGVAMQDDGVSKLLSIKLEEAEKNASK
jgi:chromosome segregation protein